MGGIADKHVEWAVVNRLKAMLDKPAEEEIQRHAILCPIYSAPSFSGPRTVRGWVVIGKAALIGSARPTTQPGVQGKGCETRGFVTPLAAVENTAQIIVVDRDKEPPVGDRQIND